MDDETDYAEANYRPEAELAASSARDAYVFQARGRSPGHYAFPALRAGHYMALSLFLILLTFFIGLTSMSNFHPQKAEAVMEALKDTFNSADFIPDITPDTPNDEGRNRHGGDLPEAQVKSLLGRTLGDLRIEAGDAETGRGVLSAMIPAAVFDNYLDALARQIGAIAAGGDLSTAFDVTILSGGALDADRIGRYAQAFAAAGFPADRLGFGLIPGAAADTPLELRFTFSAPLDTRALQNSATDRQSPILPEGPANE